MADREPSGGGEVFEIRNGKEQGDESRLVSKAVELAQEGDQQGVHFLYVRFAGEVQSFVMRIVQDHHEAEDITQNVFAKLSSAIKRYEPREVPFAAWIMRVARNAALDHLRSRRAIPMEELRIDDRGDAHFVSERGRILRHAFSDLPDEQREVLVLRHVVGLSPPEIAGLLNKTESSIHGLHHRGRRTLRQRLRDQGAVPQVARDNGRMPDVL